VTLAQRLLLAIAAVTLATAAFTGLAVREAWRRAEEARFRQEFSDAKQRLAQELGAAPASMARLVEPVCAHDPLVDSALVGLRAGDLDARRLSISLRVPELGRALELDELVLVTSRGEVLGALGERPTAERAAAIKARVVRGGAASVRAEPLALEVACRHGDGTTWVGLYAARHLDPLLTRVGTAFGLELTRDAPKPSRRTLSEALVLPELGGIELSASRPRLLLIEALQELDLTILGISAVALAGGMVLAVVLARGLSRPIVEMSRQAREVVHGEPKPVAPGGGRELVERQNAFNRAIADLVQLRKRLAATERIAARREIARRVAHEIKNPLTPIRLSAERLRHKLLPVMNTADGEMLDRATRTIVQQVDAMKDMVNAFSQYARIPAMSVRLFSLNELIKGVVELYRSQNPLLKLQVTLDPKLPDIEADQDRLSQVLHNLITNSLEAFESGASGELKGEIHIHSKLLERPSGRSAEICVSDTGPGFAPDLLGRMFDPYVTTKTKGTGLGLAIVKKIVEEHGGHIEAENRREGGALIRVELPMLAAERAQAMTRELRRGDGRRERA